MCVCVCVGGVTQIHNPLTYNRLVVSGGGRGQGRVYVYVCGVGGRGGWAVSDTYLPVAVEGTLGGGWGRAMCVVGEGQGCV